MVETLILAFLFGVIGGLVSYNLSYNMSPTIKMKNGRIRYIDLIQDLLKTKMV